MAAQLLACTSFNPSGVFFSDNFHHWENSLMANLWLLGQHSRPPSLVTCPPLSKVPDFWWWKWNHSTFSSRSALCTAGACYFYLVGKSRHGMYCTVQQDVQCLVSYSWGYICTKNHWYKSSWTNFSLLVWWVLPVKTRLGSCSKIHLFLL